MREADYSLLELELKKYITNRRFRFDRVPRFITAGGGAGKPPQNCVSDPILNPDSKFN